MADRVFDDYFSVRLSCEVRLEWLASDTAVPDAKTLAANLPPLQKQLQELEAQQQLLWTEVSEDKNGPLMRLLALQQQQLGLLAEHLLSLEEPAEGWHHTVHFSAGGLSIAAEAAAGELCKFSLRLPLGLVRGYARVTGRDEHLAYLNFVSLLESDREKLVRLALQTQSDHLRARRARAEEK
ncbi:hypothetical protein [Gallaecimonas sp. GXIMD1310]|uniref:hypothetical protein n=1 Tax=Gallaecimonas sp. GXIMD1310 TaxID=3131926 RepID=UPI00324B55FF